MDTSFHKSSILYPPQVTDCLHGGGNTQPLGWSVSASPGQITPNSFEPSSIPSTLSGNCPKSLAVWVSVFAPLLVQCGISVLLLNLLPMGHMAAQSMDHTEAQTEVGSFLLSTVSSCPFQSSLCQLLGRFYLPWPVHSQSLILGSLNSSQSKISGLSFVFQALSF